MYNAIACWIKHKRKRIADFFVLIMLVQMEIYVSMVGFLAFPLVIAVLTTELVCRKMNNA